MNKITLRTGKACGWPVDGPVVYRIVVRGQLDESWSDWLGGLAVTVGSGDDGSPVTALTGPVVDQSALLGILVKLGHLNLTLISVQRMRAQKE